MKALSLRQPWASLVVFFSKDVENRRWRPTFRGEFLIHAALGMESHEFEGALTFATTVLGHRPTLTIEGLKRGGIVGRATLYDVIAPVAGTLFPVTRPWHMPDQYGCLLRDVRPTKFVPYRGFPGFFDVPDEIAREALAA